MEFAYSILPMNCVVAYCRGGFERECAAELEVACAAAGIEVRAAEPGAAFVVLHLRDPAQGGRPRRELRFADLTFCRQLLFSTGLLSDLLGEDRVTPLTRAAAVLAPRFSDIWVETADTNAGKELMALARKLTAPLAARLREQGRIGDGSDCDGAPRLHVFLLASRSAYPCISDPRNASPWFMGIPRLKMPRSAPSRSTLKLEEALLTFLDPRERERHLRPGMRVVDLGAAPGGWTWQFVRRHLSVTAVDNAMIDRALSESGLVEHRREDGFGYRPKKPVDWLVCDIVEQPSRIARLMGQWFANGWCRRAIFNLKLPMKRRYQELMKCRGIIVQALAGRRHVLRFRQLYHDRAEVTGYFLRLEE